MRRHAIGIIALLCLVGAVVFWFYPPREAWQIQAKAACWRGGTLAALLWLAFDQLQRLPGWLLGLLLTSVAIIAIRPKTALLAVPLLIVLAILRPRFGRRK